MRVAGLFLFREGIVTSISFLDMLENYIPLQLRNWTVHLLILLTLSMAVRTLISHVDGQEQEDQLLGPRILLTLRLCAFWGKAI